MLKLTAENVENVLLDCLYKEDEEKTNPAIARGVLINFGFHPGRLVSHKTEIKELLDQLPDNFQQTKGGGWSFLKACMDNIGNQWGDHHDIDNLLCLGIASGQAKMLLPREMWQVLPGGMPYFVVCETPTVIAA